jgi:hypothetical protein
MGIAISIGLTGRIHMKCGFYEEARVCNLYILQEAILIGDFRATVIALGLLGHTLDGLGESDNALWTLKQSERIARSLNVPFFLCDTLFYMDSFWIKRKMWTEAETCLRIREISSSEESRILSTNISVTYSRAETISLTPRRGRSIQQQRGQTAIHYPHGCCTLADYQRQTPRNSQPSHGLLDNK